MVATAVTFDLDDTLAVVAGDRDDILERAANDVGASGLSRAAYLEAHRRHHANRSRAHIFADLLETTGQSAVDPDVLAAAYRERIGAALEPVPGVDALLERLSAERPIALVTNGPSLAQRDKLERLGWTDRFDAVVISGEVGRAKPAARPFHEACRRLEVDPGTTLHVGDSRRADVAGARAAGLSAVLVAGEGDRPAVDVPVVERSNLAAGLARHVASCCPV
ncbi:MAG: HAD family hydrolase [Halobacteriales archaeon]